jgi:hypothetical protein
MAKARPQAIATDFQEVIAYLRGRQMLSDGPPASLDHIKAVHRATHSLILWRFRLRKLPAHGQVFIEEIASDALQILPQVAMGFTKPTKLLVRGIIENVLRHVYFSDHPIEFARMNASDKWYVSVTELFEYIRIHPLFRATEVSFDAITRLENLYDDLSAGVHGRAVRDFQMKVALSKIVYENSMGEREAVLAARCAEAANFVIAAFHLDQFRGLAVEDRRVLLHTMPPKARQVLVNL